MFVNLTANLMKTMKQKLFTLLTLLLLSMGAFAQHQYSEEYVVYADLVDANGSAVHMMNANGGPLYRLRAYVSNELRGEATAASVAVNNRQVEHFSMRIGGDAADANKEIVFELVELDGQQNQLNTYRIQGVNPQVLTYKAGDATYGEPSNRFHLRFVKPTGISFKHTPIVMNVGETINLQDELVVTPAGANMPQEHTLSAGNSVEYLSIDGWMLKALKARRTAGFDWEFKGVARGYQFVAIIQPITQMELKPEYRNGVTVNINDAQTLTQIMNNCYTVTPADATEQPVWDYDQTAFRPTANPAGYEPIKVGTYTMTLKATKASVQLKVTVVQPVTDIKRQTRTLYVKVGDEITKLINADVIITPANATNKKLVFHVASGPNTLQTNNDGTIVAAAPGGAEVIVYSESLGKNYPIDYAVTVNPNVTAINVKKNPLNIQWSPDAANIQNITTNVMDNFVSAPAVVNNSRYTITSSNSAIVEWDSNRRFTAKGLGKSIITVTYAYKLTSIVNGKLVNSDEKISNNFEVDITQGLAGFDFEQVYMDNKGSRVITLKPRPEDAVYDKTKINVRIESKLPWQMAEITANDDTRLTWTISPKSMGEGMIVVNYGNLFDSKNLNIGQNVSLAPGWQWCTLLLGFVESGNLHDALGDNLQEIRSAGDLLYNDPVYGYFGSLKMLEPNTCYKIRVKDDASAYNFVNYGYYDPYSKRSVDLDRMWNWVGYPYQYNHTLSDVLKGTTGFTKGDRIVTKTSGFAEYDGTQWVGTLSMINGGEAFMFYNMSDTHKTLSYLPEANFPQPAQTAPAKMATPSVWTYNSAQFADNMTIVADISGLDSPEDFTVGAFVGNECRGEGRAVNGKFFITVHGIGNETVSFKLHNRMTDKYLTVDRTVGFKPMAGTLSSPLRMAAGETTNINAADLGRSGIAVINGRLSLQGLSVKSFRVVSANGTVLLVNDADMTQLPSGIYMVIVVTTDGRTITKKVVK